MNLDFVILTGERVIFLILMLRIRSFISETFFLGKAFVYFPWVYDLMTLLFVLLFILLISLISCVGLNMNAYWIRLSFFIVDPPTLHYLASEPNPG